MEFQFRQLRTHEEYEACVQLQRATWGENFSECVPPAMLMIAQKVGGVAAGAFDSKNELVGFIYGLTGPKDGKLVNWSHMLAVRKAYRGQGLGFELKLYQRQLLLDKGVEIIFWTYDPLVSRNAHINLNKLGVKIQEYVVDMYGQDSGSDLHRGIGLDRFIVEWLIQDPQVAQLIDGRKKESAVLPKAPVVNTKSEHNNPVPVESKLPEESMVQVEIPIDIEKIQQKDLTLARQWRENTRRVFQWYLKKGYRVNAFYRELESNRCFYVLSETK